MSTNTPEKDVEAGKQPERAAAFSLDVEEVSITDAAHRWVNRLRTGDPGAVPSVLGLIALALIRGRTVDARRAYRASSSRRRSLRRANSRALP